MFLSQFVYFGRVVEFCEQLVYQLKISFHNVPDML
jgi:hypothetical protein